MFPGPDCAPKSLPAPWALVPEALGSAPPHPLHGLCFAPPDPLTPPRVRRKVGVSCAGGDQEGEREVRGTQAGARGQLVLVPSMAWGRVGVRLSTGQQTPSASPAAAQERHTGFRGLGCAATGAAAPHWGGRQQSFPSPGGLGLFWKSHLAPSSCPWTAPPRRWAASTSLLGTTPPAPRGAVGHRLYHPGIKGHCPAVDLTSLPSLSKREGLSNKPRSPSPHRLVPSLAQNPTTRFQSFKGALLPLTSLTSFPSSSTAPHSAPPFIKTPSSSLHNPLPPTPPLHFPGADLRG